MKITVVYQYYQTIDAPGHSLIYDWTQYLASLGHDVTIIAGETGYMACDRTNKPWYRRLISSEKVGRVKVCRTFTYSALHKSYGGRLWGFLSFSISCAVALLCQNKPDIVVGSSPPIFPVFSTAMICKLRGIPFVMEVRDLWPESAVQMNILKSKSLISIMVKMEKILYNQARTIITLTEGIRQNICSRGWSTEKVYCVPCGVDTDQLYPDKEAGERIRRQYDLENKKIVLYFGALGEANNIPVILRAAARLKENNQIVFMLVGDGMQRKLIQQTIKEHSLTNVFLHDAVAKSEARAYINAADICLVTLLDIPLFQGALPTKLFDYMACNKMVLCGVGGEAQDLMNEVQSGLSFSPNDEKQLADLIIKVVNDVDKGVIHEINSHLFIKNTYSIAQMNKRIASVILGSLLSS